MLLSVWFGGMSIWWGRKPIRYGTIGITAICASFIALPGRDCDRLSLRNEYVSAVRQYEGTGYVWGGETNRGIDCSGLIRCGLMDAAFHHGLSTLNPGLIRRGLSLWWNDASALELKEGYGRKTRLVGEAHGINNADYSLLQPGDFAVTIDGVHTMAYVGNQYWVEADPGAGKVITVEAPNDNPWLKRPVKLMRWTVFVR